MSNIKLLGIDLAKNVFQLIGLDSHHNEVYHSKLRSRAKLRSFVLNLPPCKILMEACGTSNYWGRTFEAMGHEVKLISPQHVTPYVGHQKNDYKDTVGILEAGTRPRTKFVGIKTLEQQDIQSIIMMRKRIIETRVSLSNQIRGLLGEYGVEIRQGYSYLRSEIADLLSPANEVLSLRMKSCLLDLSEEFESLSKRIKAYDQKVLSISKENELCQRLETLPGVGPIISTTLFAKVGNGRQFKNGREMAASLGLVPKQHSSGGREILLGITRNGDKLLRELLIHGARAVVRCAGKKTDKRSRWIQKLLQRKHYNVVATALANRTARMAWAMMQTEQVYDSEACIEFSKKVA